MIFDILENCDRYVALNAGFAKAFAFLKRADLQGLPAGRYMIDPDRVHAIVAREAGRKKEDCQLERHEKYIDIQLVLDGIDNMGWKPCSLCLQPSGHYDQEADIAFFADPVDVWLPVQPGMFAIFFPEDAHLPLISATMIHKIIVKVALPERI